MGMYTELDIGIELKEGTPKEVIDILSYLASNENVEEPALQNHPLFSTDRWRWILRSSGSYYFDRRATLVWEYDKIVQAWFLSLCTNIKNYDSEWEKFIDWISPWIATNGYLGSYRYEEDDLPTLLYRTVDGKILWIRVPPVAHEVAVQNL